jgi:murein DD-endopeptidase MepM/ murein hydrolase activator NlpD
VRGVGIGALALAAALCTWAVAAVGGDNARLPGAGIATAASPPPVEHPGLTAKRVAAREHVRLAVPSDDLSWPLHGEVTGRFGEARGGHAHEGIDIPMPVGTPIHAASAGTVVMRELQDGYGKYTCIAHVETTTCYGHQERFHTTLGAAVTRGQVIGYVGNSGNSPVTHLHFEVRRGTKPWGTAVNPAKFLPRGG